MHFPAEKCSFGGVMAGPGRKPQEIGFRAQEARMLANFHKTHLPAETHLPRIASSTAKNNSCDQSWDEGREAAQQIPQVQRWDETA